MNSITKIAELVAETVQSQLEGGVTLTAIEQTMRKVLHEIGQQAAAIMIEAGNSAYPEAVTPCGCGGQASYIRQRSTRLHTVFGKLSIRRAYYLCRQCRQGCYPLDKQLGLRPNALSAELERLGAMVGIQQPFGSGRDLFESLTLVSVSDQTMSKASRAVGAIVAAQEEQWQAQLQDEQVLLGHKREKRQPLRLYGALDATKVHIRNDKEHRWRDLKVGVWFEARGKPPTTADGDWCIRAENISYYTDICSAQTFGQLLWSTGVARRAQLASELIILGDGAAWIWNLVAEHFPKAIQILDWFHASEHLLPVAEAAFPSREEQTAWVAQMKQLLWDGRIEEVIAACDRLAERCPDDRIRTTANYFDLHKARMRYRYFRQQGYQIGSGTIESAAKQIGTMRMKVPGAIWNEDSARKVAKARAAYLSDQWRNLPLAL